MGLFDFFSDAGEDELTKSVEVSQERLDELRQENITRNLAKLDIEGEPATSMASGRWTAASRSMRHRHLRPRRLRQRPVRHRRQSPHLRRPFIPCSLATLWEKSRRRTMVTQASTP